MEATLSHQRSQLAEAHRHSLRLTERLATGGQAFNDILLRERLLARLSQALVRDLSLDRLVAGMLDQCREIQGFDTVALWQVQPSQRSLGLLGAGGLSAAFVDRWQSCSFDAPILEAQAARFERRQLIQDVSTSDLPAAGRRVYEKEGLRTLLALPLVAQARLVGVMSYATRVPRSLSLVELEYSSTLANLFALAIHQIELVSQTNEALQLRDEFMVAAAHGLRSPVTAVKGWSDLLLRRNSCSEPERKALTRISAGATRIGTLVEDLLAHARSRRDNVVRQPTTFDLSAVVRDLVHAGLGPTDLNQLQCSAECPGLVKADKSLLTSALRRLVENAIDSAPVGSQIDLATQVQNRHVIVSVVDRATDIPPERVERLFEPLYEAMPSGTTGYNGTVSLGLYLARQSIEAQGGRIWAESTSGQGTTVSFSLPLAAGAGLPKAGPE